MTLFANPVSVFFLVCLFALVKHSYSDWLSREVDSRVSWVAQGYLAAFLLGLGYFWVYLLGLFLVYLVGGLFWRGGDGDLEIFGWLLPGFLLIGLEWLFVFLVLLFGLTFWVGFCLTKQERVKKRSYVPVILMAFCLMLTIYVVSKGVFDEKVVEENPFNNLAIIQDTNYPNPYCWGPTQQQCPPYKYEATT